MLTALRLFFVFGAVCAVGFAWIVAADIVIPAYDPAEEAGKSIWFVVSTFMLGLSMMLCAYSVCRVSPRSHRQLVGGALIAAASVALFVGAAATGAALRGALVSVATGGVIFVGFAHWAGRVVAHRAEGHLTAVGD